MSIRPDQLDRAELFIHELRRLCEERQVALVAMSGDGYPYIDLADLREHPQASCLLPDLRDKVDLNERYTFTLGMQ